jgi:hypothetical protein
LPCKTPWSWIPLWLLYWLTFLFHWSTSSGSFFKSFTWLWECISVTEWQSACLACTSPCFHSQKFAWKARFFVWLVLVFVFWDINCMSDSVSFLTLVCSLARYRILSRKSVFHKLLKACSIVWVTLCWSLYKARPKCPYLSCVKVVMEQGKHVQNDKVKDICRDERPSCLGKVETQRKCFGFWFLIVGVELVKVIYTFHFIFSPLICGSLSRFLVLATKCCFSCYCFEIGSLYIAQAGTELMILLS